MGKKEFELRVAELMREKVIGTSTLEVPKNGYIYCCGETDLAIYRVQEGRVKTAMLSGDGKECLLSVYTEGDLFGELCLAQAERNEMATAMDRTVLKRFSPQIFLDALVDWGLLEYFIEYLALRLLERQQTIANLLTLDSEHRLAAVLLELGRRLGKRRARGLRIEERITQEDLSRMVGTTRSRVGYFLKRFCDAGLVERTPGCFLTVRDDHLTSYLDANLQEAWS